MMERASQLETYFAPPERAGDRELQVEIELLSNNPVISGLLSATGGIVAVLNNHRQIVSINTTFLEMLGIDDPYTALGLRPGEAVDCAYADHEPGGCGTSMYCSSCGAAIAIVACLDKEIPVEKKCALLVSRRGEESHLALQVRACPIRIEGRIYVLLFLQDITLTEQQAALTRTFFHDINNMLGMLVQGSEILAQQHQSEISDIVHQASLRLVGEIALQKALFDTGLASYVPSRSNCDVGELLLELQALLSRHEAARQRFVEIDPPAAAIVLHIDGSALFRVLLNMLVNALEASEAGERVRLWCERQEQLVVFKVWNTAVIEEAVALRIFQRSFSTKAKTGRGIGTYSMKLFGETVLGGKVSFISKEGEGTTFSLALVASGDD